MIQTSFRLCLRIELLRYLKTSPCLDEGVFIELDGWLDATVPRSCKTRRCGDGEIFSVWPGLNPGFLPASKISQTTALTRPLTIKNFEKAIWNGEFFSKFVHAQAALRHSTEKALLKFKCGLMPHGYLSRRLGTVNLDEKKSQRDRDNRLSQKMAQRGLMPSNTELSSFPSQSPFIYASFLSGLSWPLSAASASIQAHRTIPITTTFILDRLSQSLKLASACSEREITHISGEQSRGPLTT